MSPFSRFSPFLSSLRALVAAIPGVLVAGFCFSGSLQADGPGLGNLTYTAGEMLSTIARFDSANGAPRGHGFVVMHKGYLVVPFSWDGGGGNGGGGFSFYNVANPRSPVLTFTTEGNSAYAWNTSNYAGNLREPHGYSFTRFGGIDYACFTTNINSTNASGLQVWNFTDMDTPAPTRVSQIGLAGLNGGDYAPTPWWVFWQGGRYAYVAATSQGLFIVDLTNPAVPVVVNQFTPAQLGFGTNAINVAFVVGNLLVLTGSQPGNSLDVTGLATYDISDPANPVQLGFVNEAPGYSTMVNGERIYGARDPARIWSIANPANITVLGDGPDVADKGGYGVVQDNFFQYGSSSHYVKLNVTAPPFTMAAKNSPAGFDGPDWDFAISLGNLIFQGNDHSGSALVVQQLAPDTTAPLVNMVSPKADSVNRALTSRVGVTLTDQIDLRSVDSTSFIVRPVGGSALPGRYSLQTAIVNFWPDAPLAANTTYEVRLPAGGIKDIMGNGLGTEFISFFSTGASISGMTVEGQTAGAVTPGTPATFTATGNGQGTLLYSWNFGDGSPETTPSASPNATHSYAAPGHYAVTVTLTNGTQTAAASLTQTVHRALTVIAPTSSSTILFDPATGHVWCVNPDANTVTALNGTTFAKILETPVGRNPRTIARAPGGSIWVVNQDDATISVLHPTTGAVTGLIELPLASLPYGLAFSPDGSAAFVTTEGTGAVLRLDPATGTVLTSLTLGVPLRGVAISGDSARVFVTRFISPDAEGQVFEVNPASLALVRTIPLAKSPGPDTEASGRGLPNYLSDAAISPDGQRLWVPSKKDNIDRGLARDGLALNFESTVRSISSQIDLLANAEVPSARLDFNDRDMAQAVAFTPLGDYALVALQGSNSIDIVDAYSGVPISAIENVGRAPQGLVFNSAGTRLFVQNFMSRTVSVHDTSGLVNSTSSAAPLLAQVAAVAVEPLSPAVLLGKQLFYNADDTRMNHDGYISCASCHLDGGSDGRVWDFTDRGEGFRRTTILKGRGGMAHGRVHWSANFDEIQDFENDIRGPFDGDGFMSDTQFNAGTRSQTLGDPKSGVSPELDALAAYVTSLNTVPPSPFRQANGELTADAVAGRELFTELSCFACHSGSTFTDSNRALLHDVGTITATSGNRLGQPLPGIDTPTLKGAWQSGRYLHDGSAATILDVLTTANPNGVHGAVQNLTATQKQQLAAYVRQIDEDEVSPSIGAAATLLSPAHGGLYAVGSTVEVSAAVSDGVGPINRVEFYRDGGLLAQDSSVPYATTWPGATAGAHVFIAKVIFASGLTTTTEERTIAVGAPLQSTIRINFQPAASTIPSGYLPDSGQPFSDRGNGYSYGWSADCTAGTRDRDLNADQRYDTLCHMRTNAGAPASWEIALPNGAYDISVVFGDAGFTDQVNNINIEGSADIDNTNANFNEFTIQRTVSDGRLTLSHGAGASNPKICFIDITPVPTPVRINFQTATATIPAGYLSDSGQPFADRGNGYSYGWSADCTAGSRDRDLHADQRYDTLCHMRTNAGAPASWEIALPAGTYDIFVVFGDAGFTDQVNNINIEGDTAIDNLNTNFIQFSIQRTVTDGRLTLSHGAGASNPKICFIDVTPVLVPSVTIAALTPATGEHDAAPGVFRLSRSGSVTSALSVKLSLGGNADVGLDYTAIATTQQIPAGQSFIDVPITPIADDIPEGTETVVLTFLADPAYVPGTKSSASVTIADAPLDLWKRTSFTAPQRVTSAVSGNLADPNANGMANLLEYALGKNPLASDNSGAPTIGTDLSGRLTLTFVRPLSATDVDYYIEGANTLSGPWFTDAEHVEFALSNNPDGLTQTVTGIWLGTDLEGFLRLSVEQ